MRSDVRYPTSQFAVSPHRQRMAAKLGATGRYAAPGMQAIVAGILTPTTFTVDPREPTAPDITRPEAYIEWGAEASFDNNFRDDATSGIGFKTNDPTKTERVRFRLTEEGREFRDYHLTGIEDLTSFLISRIPEPWVAFGGDQGKQFLFRTGFDHPGTQVGKGQEPQSPPLDQLGGT